MAWPCVVVRVEREYSSRKYLPMRSSPQGSPRPPLAVARDRHHPLQSAAGCTRVLRIHPDLEHPFAQRAPNSLQIVHLHVGAMEAAADAAVGHDELLVGVTLLQLVDEAPLGGDDERRGFGVTGH